jgi:acetylornithine deacetylase/succinyl-diaminopimelate desuccinylase-like protein
VKAKGTPGHGSTPNLADNAIMRMNKVIEKLGSYRSEVLFVSTVKRYLNELAKEDASLQQPFSRLLANPELSDEVLGELAEVAKPLAEEIRPRIRITITPTMIHGGVKENVIPSECEAVFDCRILPGQNTADALQLIRELLKDVGLDKLAFE